MRYYAKISTALWSGSKKWRGIDDSARLLYFYLHTCPHVNSVGCFVLPEGYALTDLGWTQKQYRDGIHTLSEALLIGFDIDESMVRIIGYLKHDPFSNPKHADGSIRIALSLPNSKQKLELIKEMEGMKHVNIAALAGEKHTLSIQYRDGQQIPYPIPTPNPNPNPIPIIKDGDAEIKDDDVKNDDETFREKILKAMGRDPRSGLNANGQTAGTRADMAEADRWAAMPGMSEEIVLEEIRRIVAQYGAPTSFKYFTKPMQALSGALTAAPLKPIEGSARGKPQISERDRKMERLRRIKASHGG